MGKILIPSAMIPPRAGLAGPLPAALCPKPWISAPQRTLAPRAACWVLSCQHPQEPLGFQVAAGLEKRRSGCCACSILLLCPPPAASSSSAHTKISSRPWGGARSNTAKVTAQPHTQPGLLLLTTASTNPSCPACRAQLPLGSVGEHLSSAGTPAGLEAAAVPGTASSDRQDPPESCSHRALQVTGPGQQLPRGTAQCAGLRVPMGMGYWGSIF